jgi:hypothetical protein
MTAMERADFFWSKETLTLKVAVRNAGLNNMHLALPRQTALGGSDNCKNNRCLTNFS